MDTSAADTAMFGFNCGGVGQIFVANDTVIRSISVWIPPNKPSKDYDLAILFITETCSDGYPDIDRVLLNGPRVERPQWHPEHPTEWRFELDPPFALPHRGKFFLLLQEAYLSAFPLIASNADPYPQGEAWLTDQTDCLNPGYPRRREPHSDLVFEVVFCTDAPTAARRRSWGQIKSIYR